MGLEEIDKTLIKRSIKEKLLLIGNNIKKIRKQRNITQQDLAFYIFSDKCLISELETGKSKNITLGTLIKIANVLDIEINSLFYD